MYNKPLPTAAETAELHGATEGRRRIEVQRVAPARNLVNELRHARALVQGGANVVGYDSSALERAEAALAQAEAVLAEAVAIEQAAQRAEADAEAAAQAAQAAQDRAQAAAGEARRVQADAALARRLQAAAAGDLAAWRAADKACAEAGVTV